MNKAVKGVLQIVVLPTLIQCTGQKIDQATYDEVLNIRDSIKVGNRELKVYNVFKSEVISYYNGESMSKEDRSKVLVSDIYIPYKILWERYLGDEDSFTEWSQNKISIGNLNKKAKSATEYNIDTVIINTVEKMVSLTNKAPTGSWYIIFGPAWTDLGGIGNGNMIIDLANEHVNVKRISFLLPHELNHQIYDNTRKLDSLKESVLFRCINEGFASYVNQLYWGDSNPSKHLLYSASEYSWCVKNEKNIIDEAKPYFFSGNREDTDLFFRRDKKLVKGGPGAQGYFIGYRICEEYVKNNGADSWKEIYDIPITDLIKLSGLISDL